MKKPKIVFLLGSGFSRAVGMPSTEEITNEILSENGINNTERIVHHQNGKEMKVEVLKYDPKILEFLKRLAGVANRYNPHTFPHYMSYDPLPRHRFNYEDLYYMLDQIVDNFVGNFNPYGTMLAEMVKYENLIADWEPYAAGVHKEKYFIDCSASYLLNTVNRMLIRPPSDMHNAKFIIDVISNDKVICNDIFTLNHDLVVEKLLHDNRINYIDGFVDDKEVRWWCPEMFDERGADVRLFKLHGSVDWSRYNPIGDNGKPRIGIYNGQKNVRRDIVSVKDKNGVEYGHPVGFKYLVGTENKIKNYNEVMYRESHSRFRNTLKGANIVIVIGYSFGDEGINNRLFEWMDIDNNNRILIIDGNDNLWEEAIYGFRRLRYTPNLIDGRIYHKVKWIDEKVDMQILDDVLDYNRKTDTY